MAKKQKRFIDYYSQDLGTIRILADRETGVLYLSVANGGLTVLLGADGKPLSVSDYELEEQE